MQSVHAPDSSCRGHKGTWELALATAVLIARLVNKAIMVSTLKVTFHKSYQTLIGDFVRLVHFYDSAPHRATAHRSLSHQYAFISIFMVFIISNYLLRNFVVDIAPS